MELNGLANIRTIIESVSVLDMNPDEALQQIERQAILMEKYLIATQYVPNLMWYEVHMNESLFPTNREICNYAGQPVDLYAKFLEKRAA